MRYFLFSLFLLLYVSGISQGKIAFIDKEKVLDTLVADTLGKLKHDLDSETKLMWILYKKKSEEIRKCIELKEEGCASPMDTLELKQRIIDREKQIQHDLFDREAEMREASEKKLLLEWEKFRAKKGYVEWKDISPGIPLEYKKADDYTEYMILILL